MNRLPLSGNPPTIGVVGLRPRPSSPLASTTAWKQQRGRMWRWNLAAAHRNIVFNDGRDGLQACIGFAHEGTRQVHVDDIVGLIT